MSALSSSSKNDDASTDTVSLIGDKTHRADRARLLSRCGQAAGLAGLAALTFSCSSQLPTQHTTTATSSTAAQPTGPVITTPTAGQRGQQLTVLGTASWRTNHPGCAELTTTSGQELYLVGQLATQHIQGAEANTERPSDHVQITGYVPVVEPSVCGPGLPFFVEKVTRVTG